MTTEEGIAILNEQLAGQEGEVVLVNANGEESNYQNVGEFVQAEHSFDNLVLVFSDAMVIWVNAFVNFAGCWILSVGESINESTFPITDFCQFVTIGGQTIENILANICLENN